MTDIKPCPFCGEDDDLGIGRNTEDREGFPTWVYCGNCGAQGPWFYTRNKAHWTTTTMTAEDSGWNRRDDRSLLATGRNGDE
jgi:hypothetical protein